MAFQFQTESSFLTMTSYDQANKLTHFFYLCTLIIWLTFVSTIIMIYLAVIDWPLGALLLWPYIGSCLVCLYIFKACSGYSWSLCFILVIIVHFYITMIMIGIKCKLKEQLQYKSFIKMYQKWCQYINL